MLPVELVLIPLAAGMAAITAYLIAWAAEARTPVSAAVIAFLLAMMAAMLGGALVYFLRPSAATLVEGLWLAGALMSVSVFPLFYIVLTETRRQLAAGEGVAPRPLRRTGSFVALVLGLVLLNELLMGWVFTLAAGVSSAALLAGPASDTLGRIVTSPWFIFTMSAEMGLTAYWLRGRIGVALAAILAVQAAIMVFSAPAVEGATWSWTAIAVSSGLMIALFVGIMEYAFQNRELNTALARYLVRLLGVYGLMMAGLYLWLASGSAFLFAISVIAEMVLVFEAVLRPEPFQAPDRLPWLLQPRWAFELLAGIFVAELFMGAVLFLAFDPALFAQVVPALPLAGPPTVLVGNALSNGFWFFASVTGSTWFLAMMGLEMGALVVFKLKTTHVPETRYRLYLMMGCYGAFAVFYPSIYYSLVFPSWPSGTQVAVLGWSMGVGSAPLAPAVFSVLLFSYLIVGVLAALFGRRVVCSVFCTAPLMYQGTTIDAMSHFNRSSPIARKYLSSRFSGLYTATTAAVLVALVTTSTLSYLDQIGRLSVYVGGTDPSVFFFAFSFSVLWYVMFVSIPYTGNYNCVTMGYCYTGSILQLFQKVGFFKLKVRDRQVCRDCTTLDCAKSCPVGLVDMPGHFRSKGEFRSTKCCGVGNCVGACPYGNLYIYDVRHAIAERFGLRSTARPMATLPMAGRRATSAAAAASGGPVPETSRSH
jgi:polyferredoxin